MKGFLQEYGIIMVVVAVVLGMLAFGKTGYAKSIQDAILGSADHIVETGENITKEAKVKPSDILNIEGKEYIVLEKQGNSQALVMTTSSIGNRAFQLKYDIYNTWLRPDGQYASTYEGSEIDNYLENEWYNDLSSTMKAAIQTTSVKQASYESHEKKYEIGIGTNGQVYNTINRHVFLPSIGEVGKIVDLDKKDKVIAFLKNSEIWTRDCYKNTYSGIDRGYFVWGLQGYSTGALQGFGVSNNEFVRPAFVIDLSKVDYTEAGHTDYK